MSDFKTTMEKEWLNPETKTLHPKNAEVFTLDLHSGATLVPREIDWLWNGWLPAGKFVILAGEKTAGKSSIAFNLLATITRGGTWPNGSQAPLGDVAVWSGEDDWEDTILPRFLAAGADPARIWPIERGHDRDGKLRAFDPSTDVAALHQPAKKLPNLKIIVIDPIVPAIPDGIDSHKNTETRRGLQPLVSFAAEYGVTLLGVTHFTKNTIDKNPIDRITGSLAFSAIPRVILAAATDTEGKSRRLVRVASNIGLSGGGIEFVLTQEPLLDYNFSAQNVRWGDVLQGTAKDLLEMKSQTELMRATQFLLEQLDNGPVAVKELEAAARANGVGSWRTVQRAKDKLPHIKTHKDGKTWVWKIEKPEARHWN